MEFKLKQIAEILNGKIEGSEDISITTLSKIQDGKPGSISFLANPKYESFIYETKASAVIVNNDFNPTKKINTTLLRVEDSYGAFTTLLEFYQKFIDSQLVGIEEPSFIGEGSSTGDQIYRGAFSYVGRNTTIGNNVKIFPHATIGDNVTIGDNSVIHPGARIMAGSQIGQACFIQANAVIGSDGFGYAPDSEGVYKTVPQLGHVILEDNVHIGANTTIDKATMSGDATLVKNGTKIDNLVQIAHNVVVGKNTVIASQTGVSGSSVVGDSNILGGQVGVAGHVTMGPNMIVGAKGGVSKNYPKGNEILMGMVGFHHKDFKRSYAVFRRLPDLKERLDKLEEKILNLPTV